MTVTSWAGLPSCWEDAAVPSDDYVSPLLLLTPWSSSPIPAPSFSPLGLHQEPSPTSSPISPPSQPFQLLGPHQELLLPCSFSYLASFTDLPTVGSSRVTWSPITQLLCRQPALIWSPYFPHFFWKLHMVRRLFEILVPCVLIETRLQSFQQHPICIAQSFLAYYWVSGSFYLPLIYSIYGRRTTLIEKQRRTCWNRKQ